MIYLNKALFWPAFIFFSALFAPAIIVLGVCCILIHELQVYIILAVFVALYILIAFLLKRESENKRYYMQIKEEGVEICYPNLKGNDDAALKIVNADIIAFEYYKLTSFVSWLALVGMQAPKALFIEYHENGKAVRKAIGYIELDEIREICRYGHYDLKIH